MKIALTLDSHSTLLRGHDADLTKVAQALSIQINQQAAPLWDRGSSTVTYFPAASASSIPLDAAVVTFYDAPDSPGVLGYHYDNMGRPLAKVFAQPAFQLGSGILTGPFSICQTACHEGLELWQDPDVNTWRDLENGWETPEELCDAVENDVLMVTLPDHSSVPGSNFVLPSYFDPLSVKRTSRFDFVGTVSKPFGLSPGGYQILRSLTNGRSKLVFGANYPEVKKVASAQVGARSS
jgi:hypothetical protein